MKTNARLALAFIPALFFLSANLSHGMGRIPKEVYQKKAAELEALRLDFDRTKKQCDLERSNLQAKLDEEKTQKAQEVDKLKSTYDNLMEGMKKEIEQGSIQITQLQGKLSVSLVDQILFRSGQSKLNEQGEQVLKRVADILKNVSGKQIRIEGHTDNVPISEALKKIFPSNWELSTARATTVVRYLEDMGGISPQLLIAAGYGQTRPIADNGTAEGRAKNRRIEIALIPLEGSAAAAPPPAPSIAPLPAPPAPNAR